MHFLSLGGGGVVETEVMQNTMCYVECDFGLCCVLSSFCLFERFLCIYDDSEQFWGVGIIIGKVEADAVGCLVLVEEFFV